MQQVGSSVNFAQIAANQETQKEKKVRNKGFLLAPLVGGATTSFLKKHIVQFPAKLLHKTSNLSRDELLLTKTAVDNALSKSGVLDKGVNLVRASDPAKNQINQTFAELLSVVRGAPVEKNVPSNKALEVLTKELDVTFKKNPLIRITDRVLSFSPRAAASFDDKKASMAQKLLRVFENGKNAAYLPNTKTIILPDEKLALSGFHEIGHAMNANLSKVGKVLQKSRRLALLSGVVMLYATATRNKQETEDKPLTKAHKASNFVRNNAGKLSALMFAPMIIEEAMATFKGNNLAKMFLDPSLLKKVKVANLMGLATYVGSALAAGVGAMLAVKVKDDIQANHEAKVAKHNENLEKAA